jgi:hypothetical protein
MCRYVASIVMIIFETNSVSAQKLFGLIEELNHYSSDFGQCVFRFEPTTTEESQTGYLSIFFVSA